MVEVIPDLAGGGIGHAREAGELVDSRALEFLNRIKLLEQNLCARIANSWNLIQFGLAKIFNFQRTVVRDRKPVRLVTNFLQEM